MKAQAYYPCKGKRYRIWHKDGYHVEVDKRTYVKVVVDMLYRDAVNQAAITELLVVQGKYNWMDREED